MQIKELVLKYQIPLVRVEVNGPGSFAGKLLIQALKGTGCGVREEFSVTNKQKRILDAFEAPLSSRVPVGAYRRARRPHVRPDAGFQPGVN